MDLNDMIEVTLELMQTFEAKEYTKGVNKE